jgi:hypothetical protein
MLLANSRTRRIDDHYRQTCRAHPLAVKRQHPRVEVVGLGQPANALGEFADPAD